MRQIVMMTSVSLDGYVAGPGGEIDWHHVDDEVHTDFNTRLGAMSTFLDGRISYELMASYWPTADQDAEAAPPIVEFARIWRDMPKIVFSRSLTDVAWNSTIRREVDPEEIRELQRRPGGDMAIGGATLAATFMRFDLIDEYCLYVNPIILGAGQPLFPGAPERVAPTLVESRTFGNGVVLIRYRRERG
ncbi:Dihydrofolate reductase [Nakamurella panacisegetis]|uniref:Dihydrofolate reductase n=1 Tax=Nakamurella panacisegetis TaxID=1090615 RepID=A0A1H0L4S6_9ACTN|nr:dihydrofolate reductase family protein [Nakamurella panacisegetis]SDO62960.1 Dihydrofolate reductase [Nakamurella panacisegetis]